MKLYAKLYGDREEKINGGKITKTLGGNEFLRVDYQVEKLGRIACAILRYKENGDLIFDVSIATQEHDYYKVIEEHEMIIEKGKK